MPNLAFLKPYLDYVLILSSEPEMPDAVFVSDALKKISLGKNNNELNSVEWMIDGGVGLSNIRQVMEVHPNIIVMGRAIFKDGEISKNIYDLKKAIKN